MKKINKLKETRNWITLQILLLYIACVIITMLCLMLINLKDLSPKNFSKFILLLIGAFFSVRKLFFPWIENKIIELNKPEDLEENKIADFVDLDLESKDQINHS